MTPIEITPEIIAERDAYCAKDNIPTDIPFLEACKRDPILFFTHMLGFKPYAWQYLVLKEYMAGKRKIVLCCSRQVGKSSLISGLLLYRAIFNKGFLDNPVLSNWKKHTNECVVSRGDEQATQLLSNVRQMFYVGDKQMSSYKVNGKSLFGESWFSSKFAKNKNAKNGVDTISLQEGLFGSVASSVIRSLPPTDIILGNSFTGVFADEAARISDTILIENINPTLDAYGTLYLLASTPVDPTGFFYTTVDPEDTRGDNDFTRFMFTIDCLKNDNPAQYERALKEIKKMLRDGKQNEVQRNYYCSFTSSENTYFPMDFVDTCFDENIKKVDTYRGEPVVVGVDFGGMATSHTVITVSTIPDSKMVSKRIACWRYPVKQDGDVISDLQYNVLPNFKVQSIVVDSCPASQITIQNMRKMSWNVVEFNFNRTSKPDFYSRFRQRLCRGLLKSYPDSALYTEFKAFNDAMKPKAGFTDDLIDSWLLSTIPFLDEKVAFTSIIINGEKPADDVEKAHAIIELAKLQEDSDDLTQMYPYSRVI